MRRLLLVTSVLCAIDTTQAFAQHEVSQQLLELEEADRNIFFTMLLHGSNNRAAVGSKASGESDIDLVRSRL
ncbi:MAG: hypothetical protein WBY84_26240, partial [Pseudolabrys sp.]